MRKMQFKKGKIEKKYLVVLAAFVAAAVLLGTAAGILVGRGGGNLPAWLTVIVIILLVALPLLVLALLFAVAGEKRAEPSAAPRGSAAENGGTASEGGGAAAEGETAEPVPAKGQKTRFDGLTRIDGRREAFGREQFDDDVTLPALCREFRNFAAGCLGLYYEESDIRRFVAGLAVSHIMILQGMSGTGKTSLAYAFGEYLGNPSTVIPVQPMWKERTDLIGYYNEFTRRFNETDLLKKMYEANYSRKIYITVLDEMNIARVEYYFAEFLSLLELPDADKRNLAVVSDEWRSDPLQFDDGHIRLPANMWFIGTANNDDSTFAISDKVYDRAMVMELERKAEPFAAERPAWRCISAQRFAELTGYAKRDYGLTERDLRRLKRLDAYLTDKCRVTFGNRIMKQISEYVAVYAACGGDALEALDDILAKKVLRKLSMQNPVFIKNIGGDLCKFLDGLFGEENMPLCRDFVRRLEQMI